MITFAQLQTFLEVARLGSLTEAARELGTTQPTVSLQIKALGREVGESLVDRYGRGVRLTAAGTAMQAYASEVINGLRTLQERVKGLRGGVIGSLSIGASATLGGYLLPPILSRFRQRFPQVDIRLQVDSPEHLFRDLLANSVDLVFSIEVELPKGLVAETLRDEELVIIVSSRHPLARKRKVTPEDLSALPLVTSLKGALFRELVEEKLRAAGVRPRVAFEARHPESMRNLVANNLGYGVLFRPSVADQIKSGRLAPLRLGRQPLKGRIVLVERENREPTPLARRLADFVSQELKKSK